MIPIHIDSSAISEAFNMSESQVSDMIDYAVKEVTAEFAGEWEKTASRGLGGTREQYMRNLHVVDKGRFRGAVVLTGFLPVALEQGLSPFDMKEGILAGNNAKVGKGGARYNTIPFRLSTPGAVGESSLFSEKLPQEVYDVIKSLPQDQPVQGGGRATKPLKFNQIPKKFQQPKIRTSPEPKRFEAYKHKNPIYQGVQRVKDPVTGQNRYRSFRRVSDNSDDNSWIHKGLEARDFAGKTMDSFDPSQVMGRAVDNFLRNNNLA